VGPRRASRIVSLPFRDLAALASSATAIVSNDSAVLHLGPALGVPALGLFGSTVPAFGFARQGPRDASPRIPLPCRPCDVHGRDRCPLGHHHCMERLTPEIVLAALRPMLAGGAP
jgi:heptosyltransferase-2